MKILLPIRKVYSDKIFSGEKRFEYRKKLPKGDITAVFVYESRGCGKVIGVLKISAVHHLPLDELWNKTKDHGGIEEDYFREYFKGRDSGYALEIESYELFPEPLGMDWFGFSSTLIPQNYCLINSKNNKGK